MTNTTLPKSSLLNLNRREFLKASGLAAGGLAVGVTLPGVSQANRGTFEPNPFVYIGENGDTILHCGRCEMGQGISTALPSSSACRTAA